MELFFGMGWMRLDHSKSGLLAADRTPVFDTVLKAHVYLLPPRAEGDDGSPYGLGVYPAALRWRHGRLKPVPFMWTCRDDCRRAPNLSTYVKDTTAPAGGTTILPYDSEAVRKVQNEPSRPQGVTQH